MYAAAKKGLRLQARRGRWPYCSRRPSPLVPWRGIASGNNDSVAPSPLPPPPPPPDIDKVLVANRGEIACRVLRTCQRLGIPTVALYSSADGPNCLHARLANEAYRIGHGPAPTDSYLLQEQVLDICEQSRASFVHPGYGFLSENAAFAQALTAAGKHLIGPPPSAMQAMASKSASKAIMEAAGVPCTPGYYDNRHDDRQNDADVLLDEATRIGFPVLIKAVMGGGGKGMRLVWKQPDFREALASCQREAQASFGDAKVLLEKYLVRPRHVEVQVVADHHGNVVHLFERDCSLQRRHQKIIEEAPASDLPAAVRAQLGEMGCKAAAAVGYTNAGTVEFLFDTTSPDNAFYFCEMNTRLQVEHPITEAITSVDLVEWQLRVAAGEPLPLTQDEIVERGHAFEARIYAENPARNFLPATGTVWHHQPPCDLNAGMNSDGVRVDTGLSAGQDVGVYYDPMISKLIVHDRDRPAALKKLVKALKNYQIAGVPTNINFLVDCASHPIFGQAGQVNTGFLDDFADDVRQEENLVPSAMAQAVGAFATLLHLERRIGTTQHAGSPWSSHSGSWRMGGDAGRARRTMHLAESKLPVQIVANRDGSFVVTCRTSADSDAGEQTFHIAGHLSSTGETEIVVNRTQRIYATSILNDNDGIVRIRMWPKDLPDDYFWSCDFENPLSPLAVEDAASAGDGTVKAPMPGKVSKVNASVGDGVHQGDVVLVLEAMKMEHAIVAPCDGILREVRHKVGDVVNDGAVLLIVDSGEAAAPLEEAMAYEQGEDIVKGRS